MFVFQYMSDLHLEFLQLSDVDTVSDLVIEAAKNMTISPDYLVLCGDICAYPERANLYQFLSQVTSHYTGVIYVPGNHEFYAKQSPYYVLDNLRDELFLQFDNVYFLYNDTIILEKDEDETCVVGGTTLWYKEPENSIDTQRQLNDYAMIPDFKKFLYAECEKAEEYLANLLKVDVLVTHHGVTHKVHHTHVGSIYNPFYYHNIINELYRLQPSYVLHGHMHQTLDYYVQDTHVLTNPYGYVVPRPEFDFGAYIEVM